VAPFLPGTLPSWHPSFRGTPEKGSSGNQFTASGHFSSQAGLGAAERLVQRLSGGDLPGTSSGTSSKLMNPTDMPGDGKRMFWGGFDVMIKL